MYINWYARNVLGNIWDRQVVRKGWDLLPPQPLPPPPSLVSHLINTIDPEQLKKDKKKTYGYIKR